jgi:hypothetical protein
MYLHLWCILLSHHYFCVDAKSALQKCASNPNLKLFLELSKCCASCLSVVLSLMLSCCNCCILKLQPNFQAQKSLVQEVIKHKGHLCIFLPKFHCKLAFIEYFWGSTKKYLQENCDCSFDTLKLNMPIAMTSVLLTTI